MGEPLDWPGLPADTEVVSLWAPLHDADLVDLEIQSQSRIAALLVESTHLNDYHGLGPKHRFRLLLEGVSDLSSRGRGWTDTAGVVRQSEHNEISDADFARTGGGVGVRFGVLLNDGADYTELFATAERVQVVGSDGRKFTIEQFQQLGEDYWDAWEKKGSGR